MLIFHSYVGLSEGIHTMVFNFELFLMIFKLNKKNIEIIEQWWVLNT